MVVKRGMKLRWLVLAALLLLVLSMPNPGSASIIDLYATTDVTYGHWWGYWGNGDWSDPNANPNQVSHSYYPGDGDWRNAYLIFDLSGGLPDVSDILSVSLNLGVTNIWTDSRNDVATVSGSLDKVLHSEGTGWQSYDVSNDFITRATGSTIRYDISHTAYSGFQFESIEGGQPAFLRIETAGSSAVPIPGAVWLLGSGLLGLVGVRRRKSQG